MRKEMTRKMTFSMMGMSMDMCMCCDVCISEFTFACALSHV